MQKENTHVIHISIIGFAQAMDIREHSAQHATLSTVLFKTPIFN